MNDVAQDLNELLCSAGSPASGFTGDVEESEQDAILAFPNLSALQLAPFSLNANNKAPQLLKSKSYQPPGDHVKTFRPLERPFEITTQV